MELLSLVSVVGFALGWQRWRDTTASVALLHAVSATLLLLFVASLLNLLLPVAVFLLGAGVVLTVVTSLRMIRNKLSAPVPLVAFALLATLYWTIHSGSSLFYYDEYSHWGVFLREMLAGDALWGADTNAIHPRYLPGASLWQYYFAVFSSRPEGAAYLAQFVLLLTPLMVLWEKVCWRQFYWHVGILLLLIVSIFNFGNGFTSLYVDHLLGAWFAGTLLNYLVDQKVKSTAQLVFYVMPLIVLVLIKTTGVFFALADAGIIALLLIVTRKPNGSLLAGAIRWRRAVAYPIVTLILCASVLSVWKMNRDSFGVDAGAGAASSLVSSIASGESVLTEAQHAELSRRYLRVLLHQQISKNELSAQYNAFSFPIMGAYTDNFRLTTVSLMGLSVISMFLLWHSVVSKSLRQSWAIAAGCVWIAAVVYIVGLYLGYLYTSVSDYALLLSSYIRYAHSMLLPVFLFSTTALLPAFAGTHQPTVKLSDHHSVARSSVILAGALTAMLIFETPYLTPLYKEQPPHDFRAQTEPVTDRMRVLTGSSSLWVFFPNDVENGVLGQMLQYQLSPGRVHVEEGADMLIANPESLREELRNWEYIWFANKSAEFQGASEALIGQSLGDGLFRVEIIDAEVQFIPVADVL